MFLKVSGVQVELVLLVKQVVNSVKMQVLVQLVNQDTLEQEVIMLILAQLVLLITIVQEIIP